MSARENEPWEIWALHGHKPFVCEHRNIDHLYIAPVSKTPLNVSRAIGDQVAAHHKPVRPPFEAVGISRPKASKILLSDSSMAEVVCCQARSEDRNHNAHVSKPSVECQR